jgi:phosphoribosyl 1,2-cyclic phosphate phosphodiesterase
VNKRFESFLLSVLTVIILLALLPVVKCSAAGDSDTSSYVVFLGTGAADITKPKTCICTNCVYIREHGGKNERRFASLFVSPNIVIDFSRTGLDALKAAGIEPGKIEHILITHSHGDHLDPSAITELAKLKNGRIVLHGNSQVVAAMRKHFEKIDEKPDIELDELKSYQGFNIGKWRCISLLASHAPGEEALFYVLRGKDQSMLYATDTAWLPSMTFHTLKSEKLDIAIVEATFGEIEKPELLTVHMNLPFVRLVKRYFFEQKVMKPKGRFAVTHLSLHWCEPYDKIAPRLANEGIIVPYDGMKLEF